MKTLTKSYTELMSLRTFEERFEYLKLDGIVGYQTFGSDRWLNQAFYTSSTWRPIRNSIIVRDLGCDLGIRDREIIGKIIIHHMNPINVDDIVDASDYLLNPEYLIACSLITHNAIHYGDINLLAPSFPTERRPNDTCPWR